MSQTVSCPQCQTSLRVAPGTAGRSVRCGRCRAVFTPAPPGPPAPPPAAPPPAAANTLPPAAAGAGPASGRLDIGSATSRGRARDRNEDCFLVQHLAWSDLDVCRETALVVVTDGLGGHRAGDQAARLVIRSVGAEMGAVIAGALGRQVGTAVDELDRHVAAAIGNANALVHAQSQTRPEWKGMAATLAVVLVWNGRVVVGHVGDCRVYHGREGQLTQVTRDQTLVARMVLLGRLTPEEAARHPGRHDVTQAVGLRPSVEPASHQLWLTPGDTLVVASDGLNEHVSDMTIAEAVRKTGYSASLLANELVGMADRAGGTDNITVAVVHCY